MTYLTKYNPSNIDQAKRDLLTAATAIRASVAEELPNAWAGAPYLAGGVAVKIFSSGTITMPSDGQLPSSDVAPERAALQDAYRYYLDVRRAAKAIAPSLLPQKTWIRDGNRFVQYA